MNKISGYLTSAISVARSRIGYDIFISYKTSESKQYATLLYQGLQKNLRVFLDDKELYAGDSLPDTLKSKLKNSSVLVVVAGPLASSSSWVNQEIGYYLDSKRKPKILPVLFSGVSLKTTEAFSKLENFKGTYETVTNLSTGEVSESVITDIQASVGRITKNRIALTGLGLLLTLLALTVGTTYVTYNSIRYEEWVGKGESYLNQSRQDFAELAFAKALNYKSKPGKDLVRLYRQAREARILEPYMQIPHKTEERCMHIADISKKPVAIFGNQNDSVLYIWYDGARVNITTLSSPFSITSDSTAVLIYTARGVYDLHVERELIIKRIDHINSEKADRIYRNKGEIITTQTQGNILEIKIYHGRYPFHEKDTRRFTIPVSRTINYYHFNPETRAAAILSTDYSNGRLLLYRWTGSSDIPKLDTIGLQALSFVSFFDASHDHKTFLYRSEESAFLPRQGRATYRWSILEPDDPFRKSITLEGSVGFVKMLNDGKNYLVYKSDSKDLTIVPRFDYILNNPPIHTISSGINEYELINNTNQEILMIIARDSSVNIVDDKRLIAIYSVPNQRINYLQLSPTAAFIGIETDSTLYIWKRAVAKNVKKIPSFDELDGEIGLDLMTGVYRF